MKKIIKKILLSTVIIAMVFVNYNVYADSTENSNQATIILNLRSLPNYIAREYGVTSINQDGTGVFKLMKPPLNKFEQIAGGIYNVVEVGTNIPHQLVTSESGQIIFNAEKGKTYVVVLKDIPFRRVVPLMNYQPIQGNAFSITVNNDNKAEITNLSPDAKPTTSYTIEPEPSYGNNNPKFYLFMNYVNMPYSVVSTIPTGKDIPKSWYDLGGKNEEKIQYLSGNIVYFDKDKQTTNNLTQMVYTSIDAVVQGDRIGDKLPMLYHPIIDKADTDKGWRFVGWRLKNEQGYIDDKIYSDTEVLAYKPYSNIDIEPVFSLNNFRFQLFNEKNNEKIGRVFSSVGNDTLDELNISDVLLPYSLSSFMSENKLTWGTKGDFESQVKAYEQKGGDISSIIPIYVKTPEGFSPDKIIDNTKGENGKDGINGTNGRNGVNGKNGIDDRYRIYGSNRIQTAIELAGRNYKQAENVVIADSRNYPDALTGGVLAYYLNGPILLTDYNLNSDVSQELDRLNPKNVYIVGGENSISKYVERILSKKYKVFRLSGVDRYETSEKVAQKIYSIIGNSQSAVLADGTNYPDALTSSMIAIKKKSPILLTYPNKIPESTAKFIGDEKLNQMIVVGGENSVSKAVYDSLSMKDKSRIAGKNRYETSVLIAKQVYNDPKDMYIASGENYADALCASPIAAKNNSPILLSSRFDISNDVENYVNDNMPKVYVVGGINSISPIIYYKLMEETNQGF